MVTMSGFSVAAAGDVNGDGFADSSSALVTPTRRAFAGESYVVFGKASGFAASLDLATLDGTNGFRLDGSSAMTSGCSVAAAGDVNGDGFADVIVGAHSAGMRARAMSCSAEPRGSVPASTSRRSTAPTASA